MRIASWVFASGIAVLLGVPAVAAPRPVVVELFTSQACSDCPPADALLRRLQQDDPGILALDLHVTYFNGPGWTDPFSFKAITERQEWYASAHHAGEVYTPQAVIDGRTVAVGSQREAIVAAIERARRTAAAPEVAVSISPEQGGWHVSVQGRAASGPATVRVLSFDEIDRTAVRGGENGGAELTEIHVVRSVGSLGAWTGAPMDAHVPSGPGAHIAVLVQQSDGTMLGAGSL